MQKKPSAVRLPVRNSRSRGSMSLVSRWALLASVRAIISVGDQGSKPIDSVLSLSMVNLIRAGQRLIDAPDDIGHAIHWIQALVGIHLASIVGIGGHLPTAHIDSLQSSFDLLNGLITGHG